MPDPDHRVTNTDSELLREYYRDKDFITSIEGILKVVSVIVCIAAGVVSLAAAGCRAAAGLAGSGAGTALAAAAAAAILAAAGLLGAPAAAPLAWLYTDVVVSSLAGAALVVTSVLAAVFCGFGSVVDYLYLVLSLCAAATLAGGAGAGYVVAARRLDAARPVQLETSPRAGPPPDLDV